MCQDMRRCGLLRSTVGSRNLSWRVVLVMVSILVRNSIIMQIQKYTNKYKHKYVYTEDSCTDLDIDVKGGAEAARTDESDEKTMINMEEVLTKKHMKEDVKEDAKKQMKDGVITMRPKLVGKRMP